jgi:hypothetical protein
MIVEGLDVTPGGAQLFRARVEEALERLLRQGEGMDSIAPGLVPHLDAPPVHLMALQSEGRLANSLAESVAEALQGRKGE